MRGGVSQRILDDFGNLRSSPHARGCFSSTHALTALLYVFPACAGVFPWP